MEADQHTGPEVRVGLVSDTHDRFDRRLVALFAGVHHIVHGGDVVSDRTRVLEQLEALAPLCAVRGNNDLEGRPARLPDALQLRAGGLLLGVVHDYKDRAARARALAGGAHILVLGHSHRPLVRLQPASAPRPTAPQSVLGCPPQGEASAPVVLVINPGSAGPRRFRLPRTAGLLEIGPSELRVAVYDLEAPPGAAPLLFERYSRPFGGAPARPS